MSQISEGNQAHLYRSIHGSALEDPELDTGSGELDCVDADTSNRADKSHFN